MYRYTSGIIHHCPLARLTPATTYFYRPVGSDTVLNFTTMPALGDLSKHAGPLPAAPPLLPSQRPGQDSRRAVPLARWHQGSLQDAGLTRCRRPLPSAARRPFTFIAMGDLGQTPDSVKTRVSQDN